jgi:hypothetical protein
MKPTLARIVHLTLSSDLAASINRSGLPGNACEAGQILPFQITRVWSDDLVNGQLILDGPQNHWITSVHQGTGPDQWHWPVIEPVSTRGAHLVAESITPINTAESDRYGDWAVWRDRALFAEEARNTLGHEIDGLKRQLELTRSRENNLIAARDGLIKDLEAERAKVKRFQDQLAERDQRLASQAVIVHEAEGLKETMAQMKATFVLWDAMAEKLRES